MAYVHDFHVKAEAVTIKGTLLLKDGTTVEADKLQGIGELDVDDQRSLERSYTLSLGGFLISDPLSVRFRLRR